MSAADYLDRPLRSVAEAQRDRLAVGDRVSNGRLGDGEIVAIHLVPDIPERDFADVRFADGRQRAVPLSRLVKTELRVP